MASNRTQPIEKSSSTSIATIFEAGPHIPIALIDQYLIFKPQPKSNNISMINLAEIQNPEIKLNVLKHQNVMAVAPLIYSGTQSGLIAVSEKLITIWQDNAAIQSGNPTLTIDFDILQFGPFNYKLESFYGRDTRFMHVFHIPETDDIVLAISLNLENTIISRINIKNQKLVTHFDIPFSKSFAFIEGNHIAVTKGPDLKVYNTLTGKLAHTIKSIHPRELYSSPDGRFLLVKMDIRSTLKENLPGSHFNPSYTRLALYQKRQKDIILLDTLAYGTELNDIPQFLMSGKIIYKPAYEYMLDEGHLFSAMDNKVNVDGGMQVDLLRHVCLYDPLQMKSTLLETEIQKDSAIYILPNGKILSSSDQSHHSIVKIMSDPLMQLIKDNEIKEKAESTSQIRDFLATLINSNGVRGMILDYAMEEIFKLPQRIMPPQIDSQIISQIETLIQKNKELLSKTCHLRNPAQSEHTLNDQQQKQLTKSIDCLQAFKELVESKNEPTFKDCIDAVWKRFPEIQLQCTGFKSLFFSSVFTEVYQLIEGTKKYDVCEDKVLRHS